MTLNVIYLNCLNQPPWPTIDNNFGLLNKFRNGWQLALSFIEIKKKTNFRLGPISNKQNCQIYDKIISYAIKESPVHSSVLLGY